MSRPADFTNTVKRTIEIRSNSTCNNPNCKINTNKTNSDGIIHTIGKACHIEAASKNGPRYNPASPMDYRKSVANAIWLCSNCAELIDKDPTSFPVSLLKEWKHKTETQYNNTCRIIAVANPTGGVGCSSVTAYLSQAIAILTNRKVLCISDNASDHSGMLLTSFKENIISEFDDIKATNIVKRNIHTNIDFLSDAALHYIKKHQSLFEKESIKNQVIKLIDDNNYQFVIIDCGNGFSESTTELLDISNDIIIPIGDHFNSCEGIRFINGYLSHRNSKTKVWPLFSIGLIMSNKDYRRNWYYEITKAINLIRKNKTFEVIDSGIIIPKNINVNLKIDLYKNKKAQNVADAYLNFANYLLSHNKKNLPDAR